MRIRTILAAAAAPAALAAVLLGTAGQASAAVSQSGHTDTTIQLSQHADTDFYNNTWALDNFSHHEVVSNVQKDGPDTFSYDVQYDDHGTFVANQEQYIGSHYQPVPIPGGVGAHGVMSGTGSVHVTGATQVPDQKYLKGLSGDFGITATLAPTGTIQTWHYDYQYKIPGTSFTAEQSDVAAQNVP
jgi:hypothetical protein